MCEGQTPNLASEGATPAYRSDELIYHDRRLAAHRVRSVLDALEGLHGSSTRQPIEEAHQEVVAGLHEQLAKTTAQRDEAQDRLAIAQGAVTMLADHLTALHSELGDLVAGVQARTKRSHKPVYLQELEVLLERQAAVVADVVARAAVG